MKFLGGIEQAGQQQAQAQPQQPAPPRPPVVQSLPPQSAAASSAPTAHIMQNQAGQLVYVSTHPTLGNVGPMVYIVLLFSIVLRYFFKSFLSTA